MPRWELVRPGRWEYLELGFAADDGDILIADAAPDSFWVLAANQSAAATVSRHALGSRDRFDGGIPGQHAVPMHLDGGTPTTSNFDLMDGGTP